MPAVSVLVKPASSACNMTCDYCFYRDEAEQRTAAFKGFMTLSTAEHLLRRAIDFADQTCSFLFQGGEPTLVGLDWFRQFLTLEERIIAESGKKLQVFHAIQTNGYALDGDWAAFFAEHQFLVGVSLDGTQALHDKYRHGPGMSGSFEQVRNGIHLLEQYHVEYNILSVVTADAAEEIGDVYRFFREQKFQYLQFIPCLAPLEAQDGVAEGVMTTEQYGDYLVNLFTLWFTDLKRGRYISIRHIDNLMLQLLGRPPESCNMTGRCGIQFMVEGNGDVYPCDFYGLDDYCIGNVETDSFRQMAHTKVARNFLRESYPVPELCKTCHWYGLCRNGCKRDRGPEGLNKDCAAYRHFYETCEPELREAVRLLSAQK